IARTLTMGDAELEALTIAYFTPIVFVGPIIMFTMGMAQFMRADGHPRASALVVVIANIVNLVLDYVFLKWLQLGIASAGLATVLGYVVGALALLPWLRSTARGFRLALPSRKDFRYLVDVTRVGMPLALTEGTSFLRTLILNGMIVFWHGGLGMAVMTVCMHSMILTYMFVGGTADAVLPIVGTLYGERDYFGVRSAMRDSTRFLILSCTVIAALLIAFPAQVGRLYGIRSPEGMALLVPALRLYALSLPFHGFNQILQSFYQSTGREKLASVMAVLDGFVFVVIFALLLAPRHLGGVPLLWLSFSLSGLSTTGFVYAAGVFLRKDKRVSKPGVLLLREEKEPGAAWDVTIPATTAAAVGLSEKIIGFCTANGVHASDAGRLGIAAEEMAVNTALYSGKTLQHIDVLVRCAEEALILRLRDDGAAFDPTTYASHEEGSGFITEGIRLVKQLATNVFYARQLGFNVTIVTLPRRTANC
ncbi:MAG: MATE family efflux transporter, partial [Synergistaceae bacterium]|nr:MATE family efflux transporter [Synergistaceae bacterium]